MADEKKGLTVKIDAELHAQVREYVESHGMTMAEFVSQALDTGYGGVPDSDSLKAQMEMFEELKRYAEKNPKDFDDFLQLLVQMMECKTQDKQNNIYVERIIPSVEMVNFAKILMQIENGMKMDFCPQWVQHYFGTKFCQLLKTSVS